MQFKKIIASYFAILELKQYFAKIISTENALKIEHIFLAASKIASYGIKKI